MLHYHLSILLLVDIIEATEQCDLGPRAAAARAEAETWVLNCLDFGLNNTFVVSPPPYPGVSDAPMTATVSIICIHPYPHHVVAGVDLLPKAFHRDFAAKRLVRMCETICSQT